MIVIKIEMWPKGDSTKAQEFGRAYISNLGETTKTDAQYGDYSVQLYGGVWGRWFDIDGQRPWRTGRVERFNRSSQGVWHLLTKAIQVCLGGSVSRFNQPDKE